MARKWRQLSSSSRLHATTVLILGYQNDPLTKTWQPPALGAEERSISDLWTAWKAEKAGLDAVLKKKNHKTQAKRIAELAVQLEIAVGSRYHQFQRGAEQARYNLNKMRMETKPLRATKRGLSLRRLPLRQTAQLRLKGLKARGDLATANNEGAAPTGQDKVRKKQRELRAFLDTALQDIDRAAFVSADPILAPWSARLQQLLLAPAVIEPVCTVVVRTAAADNALEFFLPTTLLLPPPHLFLQIPLFQHSPLPPSLLHSLFTRRTTKMKGSEPHWKS